MARIDVDLVTNEVIKRTGERENWGSWNLNIAAGIDEDPGLVLGDAQKRIEAAINALPAEKRYSRFGHIPNELIEES